MPRLGQPQHSKMPARRNAMSAVKGLAERSFAYRKDLAQARNMKRLFRICERQSLRSLDEIAAWSAAPGARSFRHSCDPPVAGHRKLLNVASTGKRLDRAQHTTARRSSDIALWGNRRFFQPGCRSGGARSSYLAVRRFLRRSRARAPASPRAPQGRRLLQTIGPAISPSEAVFATS